MTDKVYPLCGNQVQERRTNNSHQYWCEKCQHGWPFTVFWQISRCKVAGWSDERIRSTILAEDNKLEVE